MTSKGRPTADKGAELLFRHLAAFLFMACSIHRFLLARSRVEIFAPCAFCNEAIRGFYFLLNSLELTRA